MAEMDLTHLLPQLRSRFDEPGPSTPKGHLYGCHRLVDPEVTVARVKALMPQLGITRLADITGLDRIGVPVVMVCRPNARSVAVSQGKGLTLMAASASGLMEAAELYHGEHIDLPLKLGSLAELEGRNAFADVSRLPRISDRFSRDLVMLWIEALDLYSGESRFLPFESVRANFTLPPPPGSGCFDCSTNGLASGNSRIEATCHAICEVVERDATSLWHAEGVSGRGRRGLDPATVNDPACRAVMDRLEAADFDVTLWETTTDCAIPSFFCLIADRRDADQHIGIGAGTHAVPAIALMRALTEAVQVRTTYISGSRDDLTPKDYTLTERRRKAAIAASWRETHRPARDFAEAGGQISADFASDLGWLLGQLGGVGIEEVLTVDLSKPEIGLAVVRAVIPGLEGPHDHPAYRPGPRVRAILQQGAVG